MTNAILFVSNDGTKIDIFHTSEDIALHLRIGFAHRTDKLLYLLPFGGNLGLVTGAIVGKLAGALQKIKVIIVSPMLDFSLADKVHRSNQLHTLKVGAMQLWHHSLHLTSVEHTHQHRFDYIVIMVTQRNLVAAQFLCLAVQIAPTHTGADIAR